MPCHGCASNFSLFSKEQSCPNCRFSFCSKCLKEKINLNDKNQKVCNTCFKQLSNNTSTPSQHEIEPPALLLKRLQALDNPAKPPIIVYKHNQKKANFEADLDPEDRQIYERLQKLRESRKKAREPPTNEEIMRRLLTLKGMDESTTEKLQLLQPPRKSQQDQVDDLLNQYMEETEIEEKMKEADNINLEDIEGRLKKLHASDNSASQNTPSQSNKSEDCDSVAARRILEKALAEAKLEKKWENSLSKSDSDEENMSIDSDEEEPELSECIICSEYAVVRCLGCDRSLYCQSCYNMGHESYSMKNHKTIKIDHEEISE